MGIKERSSQWKHKIIPPPKSDLINHPLMFFKFLSLTILQLRKFLIKICTQSCKLSLCLGLYPMYTRKKVFLYVLIFSLLCCLFLRNLLSKVSFVHSTLALIVWDLKLINVYLHNLCIFSVLTQGTFIAIDIKF